MKKSFFILTLSLLLTTAGQAQTDTKVIVEAGASRTATQQLQTKTEKLLSAINEYIVNGNDSFPNEPGVETLKELITTQQLISTQDTLGTMAVRYGTDWELPRIFLQKLGGRARDVEELIFIFDKNIRLKSVVESDPEKNINRILSRNIVADADEQTKLQTFIDHYIEVFNTKNIEQLPHLFDTDADIIIGSKSRNHDGFDFNRTESTGYVERTQSRTFVAGNEINLSFEQPRYLRHPDVDGVYGFTAKQNWTTTAYSDVGYLFLVIDTRGDAPHVELRQWQEHEFVASRFADITPDPWVMAAGVTAVSSPREPMGKVTGVILLDPISTDESQWSAQLVKEELEKGDIILKGVTVSGARLSADGKAVQVQYTTTNSGQQPVQVSLQVEESGSLKGLTQTVQVYPKRVTRVSIVAAEKQEDLPEFGPFNAYAELRLTTRPEQTYVKIMETDSSLVWSGASADSIITTKLLPGSYILSGTKDGWQQGSLNLTIPNQQSISARLELEPVPVPVAAAPAEAAAVGKAKWWILGAAAVLIGGGAAYLLLDSEAEPGIPIPPGRPIGWR